MVLTVITRAFVPSLEPDLHGLATYQFVQVTFNLASLNVSIRHWLGCVLPGSSNLEETRLLFWSKFLHAYQLGILDVPS